VIPAFVNFGAESFPDDGKALPRAEFIRRLTEARVAPTTSAPSPGQAAEVLRAALDRAEHVIVMTVAAQLSSIPNSVRLAAQQVSPDRITVYDSGSTSMGLGWQVVAAAEALASGVGRDEILAAARDVRERVEVWAAPDTLEYLRRGGRVSALVASMGSLLQIKPIISLKEGTTSIAQRVRTSSKAIQALIALTRECAPLERLAVLHIDHLEGAQALHAQLADIAPPETLYVDVTTAISVHFGPKTLGVALVKARR
jgi:DegV family protein with EDD domain